MASKNPRVAISLPKEHKLVYQETAALMGISMNQLIVTVLSQASPTFKAIQKPLEQAQKDRKSSLEDLSSILATVQDLANKQQIDIEEQIARDK